MRPTCRRVPAASDRRKPRGSLTTILYARYVYNSGMSRERSLHGHAVLVTGAARRLGLAFAQGLAARGADVALHYGKSADGESQAEQLQAAHGIRVVALRADLAEEEQAAALVDRAVQALGAIDLLVNSAAVFGPEGFRETTLDSWGRHLAVNLTAPFLICQGFARHRAGRPGVIVNILDWRALRPGPDHFAYTVSKAALAAMTQSLAQSLAPAIRVNGLALGAVLPPSDDGGKTEEVLEHVPAGRWARPEEAVDALLFLLSGPDFMTGEILQLDGGRHLA